MKKILLLIAFISFANLNAQEINLQAMTKEQRIRYVAQEATKALDEYLYDFLQKIYGPHQSQPNYYALQLSYKENYLIDDEIVSGFNELYGDVITDYVVRKYDYTYNISFVSNPRLWKPLLYKVTILNNGKVLLIRELETGYGKIIYKSN